MKKSRRKHWFVALRDTDERWEYAGAQWKCESAAEEIVLWGCADRWPEGYWMAPGHRSRKNCDTDCDPEEYQFTVETDRAEFVPFKEAGKPTPDSDLEVTPPPAG